MRSNIRVLGPATVVIAAVVALAWASPMAAVVHLLADTAVNKTILVMGGTQHPLVNPAASGEPRRKRQVHFRRAGQLPVRRDRPR